MGEGNKEKKEKKGFRAQLASAAKRTAAAAQAAGSTVVDQASNVAAKGASGVSSALTGAAGVAAAGQSKVAKTLHLSKQPAPSTSSADYTLMPWTDNWQYMLYLEILDYTINKSNLTQEEKEALVLKMSGFKNIVEDNPKASAYTEAIRNAKGVQNPDGETVSGLQDNDLPSYDYIAHQMKELKADERIDSIIAEANHKYVAMLSKYVEKDSKQDKKKNIQINGDKCAGDKDFPFMLYRMNGQHMLAKKVLGAGVCGTAMLGSDLSNNEQIVVKTVMPIDPTLKGKILLKTGENEAAILVALKQGGAMWKKQVGLNTKNPKKFLRALMVGEEIVTIQKLAKGKPLNKAISQDASDADVGEMLQSIAFGMMVLHTNNVFHGDIKDENILYDPESKVTSFIDFGLSCETDEKGNVINESAIFYPAPSQAFQKRQVTGLLHNESSEWKKGTVLSTATDIFALGRVFEQILDNTHCQNAELRDIAKRMQSDIPSERPTAQQVGKACEAVAILKHTGAKLS